MRADKTDVIVAGGKIDFDAGEPSLTDLLDRAIARTRALPSETQDEIARMVLLYAGETGPIIQLTPEEEADLAGAEGEADRGEFATDEEVEAIFAKYRR